MLKFDFPLYIAPHCIDITKAKLWWAKCRVPNARAVVFINVHDYLVGEEKVMMVSKSLWDDLYKYVELPGLETLVELGNFGEPLLELDGVKPNR